MYNNGWARTCCGRQASALLLVPDNITQIRTQHTLIKHVTFHVGSKCIGHGCNRTNKFPQSKRVLGYIWTGLEWHVWIRFYLHMWIGNVLVCVCVCVFVCAGVCVCLCHWLDFNFNLAATPVFPLWIRILLFLYSFSEKSLHPTVGTPPKWLASLELPLPHVPLYFAHDNCPIVT